MIVEQYVVYACEIMPLAWWFEKPEVDILSYHGNGNY